MDRLKERLIVTSVKRDVGGKSGLKQRYYCRQGLGRFAGGASAGASSLCLPNAVSRLRTLRKAAYMGLVS